ncbi:MAG TPA: PEP-CTERM sorting domain-containing protein [Telluria sp.]
MTLGASLAAPAVAAPARAAIVPSVIYSVTELPGFMPAAINNAGQIAGVRGDHAWLWSPGGGIDLGTLGGASSAATALNSAGEVTGHSLTAGGQTHAFKYAKGSMTDLGTFGGGEYSSGTGINDAGQVAGNFTTASGRNGAFLHSGGAMNDLGTLGGDYAAAAGINNAGQVVGTSVVQKDAPYPVSAFIYQNGVMSKLPGWSDESSGAAAINQKGQVTGFGWEGGEKAFLYSGGSTRNLGSVNGLLSWGTAINNLGQVVGHLGEPPNPSMFGFVYADGVMRDLNTLIDPALGWVVQDAVGINDAGQIAAWGCRGDECSGLLLQLTSPVPEPRARAMLLAGLALLGVAWRRRALGR